MPKKIALKAPQMRHLNRPYTEINCLKGKLWTVKAIPTPSMKQSTKITIRIKGKWHPPWCFRIWFEPMLQRLEPGSCRSSSWAQSDRFWVCEGPIDLCFLGWNVPRTRGACPQASKGEIWEEPLPFQRWIFQTSLEGGHEPTKKWIGKRRGQGKKRSQRVKKLYLYKE